MKKWLWLIALGATGVVWAADSFSQRMTAEEFKAAGLAKLTPEELAQLDAIFGKYRDAGEAMKSATAVGKTASADAAQRRQAEIDSAAAAQAASRVAEAEARARKAEQEAAAAREAAQAAKAEQKKAEESLLTKAKKVFVSAGTKVEVAATETEIDGDFTGWEEMTTWRMADGSLWRVANRPEAYQATRLSHPKVRIYPASFAGYWLEIVDLDIRVRVRPLK